MTPEQKQRAVDLIDVTKTYRLDAEECAMQMVALLQEIVDAPEPEPVAYIEHHKGGDNLVWDNPGGKYSALYTAPQPPKLSDERILHHLDAILKASGSGMKNYSMHKTIEDMKQAVRAIEREILGESNEFTL